LPEFVDLYYPTSESAPLPAYQGLLSAQQLSLLKAAVAANAGRHAEALQEMEVEAALAGPLGAAHPDPYSGLPMRFDPTNATIGFESNSQRGSIIERLKKRYGRVAVPIV